MNHDRSLNNLKKLHSPLYTYTQAQSMHAHTHTHTRTYSQNTHGSHIHMDMQKQVHMIICLQAHTCTGMCLCMLVHTYTQTHTGFLVTQKGKAESDPGTFRHSQFPSLFCDVSSLTINFLLFCNLVMRKMKKASTAMWLSSSELIS